MKLSQQHALFGQDGRRGRYPRSAGCRPRLQRRGNAQARHGQGDPHGSHRPIPPNSFSTAKDVEERWVKTTMLEGDVLVEKKLGPKGTPPGLVANIPQGMRALAIDVTEQSGVSGFILPGHHVDVVRYREFREEQEQRPGRDDLARRAGARGRPGLQPPRRASGPVANGHAGLEARRRRHPGGRPGAGALSLSLRGVNDHELIAPRKPKPTDRPRG